MEQQVVGTEVEGKVSCGGTESDAQCRGPAPIPWVPHDLCQYFFEERVFDATPEHRVQIRVSYEHCLRRIGRQQGSLVHTVTLLPGEELRLFQYDRFRRVRSASERVTVFASFQQTLSALFQSRRSSSTTSYGDMLAAARSRSDSSSSVTGFLLGAEESEQSLSLSSGWRTVEAAEDFSRLARSATQAIEAERSIVVSHFEESEHQATTSRLLKNANPCLAVTYFVRRVNEVFEVTTRISKIEWRIGKAPWKPLTDLDGVSDSLNRILLEFKERVKSDTGAKEHSLITLPSDGCVYEAELAHCSSCEPSRRAESRLHLEALACATRRACREADLLGLELDRRRALAEAGTPEPLEIGPLVGSRICERSGTSEE